MGFDENQARNALQLTGNDLEQSINFIVSNM